MPKKFKKRPREVKNDARSERPSTGWAEVNVMRVRQVMCKDCQLTVQMNASQTEMKNIRVG